MIKLLEVGVGRSARDEDVLECAEESLEWSHPYQVQKLGHANDLSADGLVLLFLSILRFRSEGDNLKVDFRQLSPFQLYFLQLLTFPWAEISAIIKADKWSVSAYDEHEFGVSDEF